MIDGMCLKDIIFLTILKPLAENDFL